MNLQIGQNIDSNTVRLDFKKSPAIPDNLPSYKIESSKADEFVKKFNKQEKKLLQMTLYTASGFAAAGWITGLYKHSWKWSALGIPAGLLSGFGLGAIISSKMKNKLMNKYDVKRVSE